MTYLSRSQELIVVREWWAPPPGDRGRPVIPGAKKDKDRPAPEPPTPGRLQRRKTLKEYTMKLRFLALAATLLTVGYGSPWISAQDAGKAAPPLRRGDFSVADFGRDSTPSLDRL